MNVPGDAATVAGWLLIIATVLGLAPVAYPPFLSIWTGSREHHLTTVLAHERAWIALNAGFAVATAGTAAALLVLGAASLPTVAGAGILALGSAYASFGACWLVVLATRARTTPAIARRLAAGHGPDPSEPLLDATLGGLFGAFIVGCGLVLVGLGITIGVGGLGPWWLAGVLAVGGSALVVTQLVTGDCIPALVYLPTLVLGIALVRG